MKHHSLFCRGEHGLQVMGRVSAVPGLLPFLDCRLSEPKALSQDTGGFVACCDLGTHSGRSAGVFVQGYQHGLAPGVDCKDSINSFKTVLAMKSG